MTLTSIDRLSRPSLPLVPVLLFYVGMLGVAFLVAWWDGRSGPFVIGVSVVPLWLSLLLGCVCGLAMSGLSRWGELKLSSLGGLRDALSERIGRVSPGSAALMAVSSGVAEEALFRGALLPMLGVAGSSALFGVLHIGRDSRMWIWIVVAFVAGLAFAALSLATGDILAAAVAHAVVNYVGFLSLSGR